MTMFLDPEKPIATCKSESCEDCGLKESIHCHFRLKDLVHFLTIAFPSFLIGGAGIFHVNGWVLVPWLLFVFAYFGFIEIRVMCSHCPHYAENLTSLKCWANYGSPKPWKYRPGPMSIMEKTIFFLGFAIIWGTPLPFLIAGRQVILFLVYLLTSIGFFMTLMTFLCSQCMNFACPLNRVDKKIKEEFFKKNPVVAEAWKK